MCHIKYKIILNINGLHTSINRQRLPDWILKAKFRDWSMCLAYSRPWVKFSASKKTKN
jgi:hypothetical protein